MSTEAPHLIRLGDVLQERGAPVLPILSAVTKAGTSSVYLSASTRSRRLDLLVPFHPDALAAIAPQAAPSPVPPRAMLRICVDVDQLGAALVVVGAITPREAVDELAPPDVRDAWFQIVDPMPALANGTVTSRTRFITEQRGAIVVRYPDRDASADERLVQAIDELAARLGVADVQRAMWKKLHPTFGSGAAVSISTQCSSAGPTLDLGFTYRSTEWDHAVQLTKVIVDIDSARQVASALGKLAGALQSDHLQAVELVLGPQALPDVVVWITLRPD